MATRTASLAAFAAVCTLQVLLAAAEAPAIAPTTITAGAPGPVANAMLDNDLTVLGIPAADLVGRVLPGANPAQINSAISSIINGRITDAFQLSTQAANLNTQEVLAALANPNAVPALSPSAKVQYEIVETIYKNPTYANPPTRVGGRKLMMA